MRRRRHRETCGGRRPLRLRRVTDEDQPDTRARLEELGIIRDGILDRNALQRAERENGWHLMTVPGLTNAPPADDDAHPRPRRGAEAALRRLPDNDDTAAGRMEISQAIQMLLLAPTPSGRASAPITSSSRIGSEHEIAQRLAARYRDHRRCLTALAHSPPVRATPCQRPAANRAT